MSPPYLVVYVKTIAYSLEKVYTSLHYSLEKVYLYDVYSSIKV